MELKRFDILFRMGSSLWKFLSRTFYREQGKKTRKESKTYQNHEFS